MKDVPVMELCGVNKGIAGFLAQRGAVTCGTWQRLPVSVLGKRFGNPGRRIWQMCRGEDPVPVETKIDPPKAWARQGNAAKYDRQGCHLHVPDPHGRETGVRLRQHSLAAREIFHRTAHQDGWVGSNKLKTAFPDQRQPAHYRIVPAASCTNSGAAKVFSRSR